MVHSFRVGALVAILACSTHAASQGLQPDSFVTVREDGKPASKCRVVKCWKEPDGSRVCQVQDVASGEMMTVVDGPAAGGTPAAHASRVFNWGKSKTSPAGVPVASSKAQVVSTWTEPARPGLMGKLFGSSTTSTPVVQASKPPADLRQSWGKVDTSTPMEGPKVLQTSSRPAPPLASKKSADPLERPDIYTTAPAGMPPVKTESVVRTTALPTPAGPQATSSMPVVPASKSTAIVSSTTTGDCGSCTPCDKCDTCTTGKPTTGRSFGLRDFGLKRAGLFSGRGTTTVVHTEVKESPAGVVTQPQEPAILPSHEVAKKEVVKVREAKATAAPEPSTPHVGVFAGLVNPRPAAPAQEATAKTRSNLPAGMSSVAGAAKAATGNSAATPVGAIVRMPDGQHRVVDLSMGGGVPATSVPVNSGNAFTAMAQAPPSGYYPNHQTLANAFTLPTPSRPLPSDMMMSNEVANGLNSDGMGGAERRPSMAMAYAQQMQAMQYGMALTPVPAGVAMASNYATTTQHLATLRQSLMPSERERAVASLVQIGWKTDPQVVPALVLAAQTDPAPAVRLSCVKALGEMKANTMPAVQALTGLTKDHDARVRQEAERVLPALTKP